MSSVLATVTVIIVAVECRSIEKSRLRRRYEDAKVAMIQQGGQGNDIDLILSIDNTIFKILLHCFVW